MLENGFIKVHRSLLNWEWYQDTNTKVVFLHLLLTVNYEDGKWKGKEINRGQRITSYQKLSDEINISVQSVRTAIKHLILTGEVTIKTTSENSMITVINYDKYQQLTNQPTNDQQAANKPLTNDQQAANNKGRKYKKDNKEKESNNVMDDPALTEIEAYCIERGNDVNPKKFFDYFDASGWIDSKGNKVRNWKQKVITWEKQSDTNKTDWDKYNTKI